MFIINALKIFIIFVLLPLLLGGVFAVFTKRERITIVGIIAYSLVIGNVFMWAMFQLLAVPMILLKAKLTSLLWLWVAAILLFVLLAAFCCRKRSITDFFCCKSHLEEEHDGKAQKALTYVFAVLAAAVVCFQCYKYIFEVHIDEDDSRFLVNALDAYQHNHMYLCNPADGTYAGTWVGELVKDISSPWMIYVALVSKIIGIHPAIVARTIMPPLLLLMGYCAYYLIGELLWKRRTYLCFLTVAVAAVVNMYFGDSPYTQSNFTLIRIWQGKSVVAAVMLPLFFALLLELYKRGEERRLYVVLLLANLASCLLSGMGIFFAGIMIGVYGLWYNLIEKRWRSVPYVMLACVPTIVYGLTYVLMK